MAKTEKELEEIHKVIEESGGKLSNRLLQCDVRLLCFLLTLDLLMPSLDGKLKDRWMVD